MIPELHERVLHLSHEARNAVAGMYTRRATFSNAGRHYTILQTLQGHD